MGIANAVGTDLLYACVTKSGGVLVGGLNRTVDWRVVGRLSLGSLPAAVLGVLVSLSSVGAGALGATALILLYPELPASRIAGSDIAHAVPLTLVAGIGHLFLGTIDTVLLFSLLAGSLPGNPTRQRARRVDLRALAPLDAGFDPGPGRDPPGPALMRPARRAARPARRFRRATAEDRASPPPVG